MGWLPLRVETGRYFFNCNRVPYILAYKSPPKNRVCMLSKIIDPRISRRWLLRPGLVLDASFAQQRPIQRLCARAAINSVVTMSDQRQGRPLAARWGRRALASAWPLKRNWDRGRSYSERRERCGRPSFPKKMRDVIVVGDPLISDDRSPANTVFERSIQAHLWTDRCEPMVPSLYLRLQRCSIRKR